MAGDPPQTPCLILLYTVKTFYKSTVLALKRFIVVEKEQNAPILFI